MRKLSFGFGKVSKKRAWASVILLVILLAILLVVWFGQRGGSKITAKMPATVQQTTPPVVKQEQCVEKQSVIGQFMTQPSIVVKQRVAMDQQQTVITQKVILGPVGSVKIEKPAQVVAKPEKVAAKPKPKVAAKPVAKPAPPVLAAAPVPTPLPVIPRAAPEARLILRLNIVEWSQVFEGKSLMSRDIGGLIRRGLSDGTVRRTVMPVTFNVNGATVIVQNGEAVLDPGPIGPETTIVVQPSDGAKFVSPPSAIPLVTRPEELNDLVKKGVREIWLNFVLAHR